MGFIARSFSVLYFLCGCFRESESGEVCESLGDSFDLLEFCFRVLMSIYGDMHFM